MNADFTNEATEDCQEIWQFYARQANSRVANEILGDIYAAIERIEGIPSLGHFRSDLITRPYRFYLVHGYHIIYDPLKSPIYILRIRHSARQLSDSDLP